MTPIEHPKNVKHWGILRVGLVAASAIAVVGLATADVVEIISPNEEGTGGLGAAVAGIPDMNDDGFDDVIVGAPGETSVGLPDAGRVYIVSGATGLVIRTHSSPNDANAGRFGGSVDGIRDIDGDGHGDYIVGARGEPGPGGRVYIYSGLNGSLIRTHTSPNAEAGGEFGRSVSGIPDVTGDGRGDYIVGAPNENNGGTSDAGRAYVYSGNTGNLWDTLQSPNPESFGNFGYDVDGGPDMNNDNRGDTVVGAPMEDPGGLPGEAGKAYVFNGNTGALLHSLTSGDPESGGRFGHTVAALPDVGGNGLGDVLVGAPDEDFEQTGDDLLDAGQAYLFSGSSGNLAATFSEPEEHRANDSIFGSAVGAIDDRDGDGLAEMIIGAPGWPGYYAYIYGGGAPYDLMVTENTPDDLGADQFWAGAVNGAGDVNGDGLGDYIIGGSGSDNFPEGRSGSGRAYLYRDLYNDGCSIFSTFPELTNGDNFFSTIGATQGSAEDDCAEFADPGFDAWFFYEATCTGPVNFSTCGQADFNTKIAVYEGCSFSGFFSCDLSTLIGCNDNFFFCIGGTSTLTVDVVDGECYRVRIGGVGDENGSGTITVSPNCIGCDADLNNDGQVDGADYGLMLGQWGGDGSGDLDGNNIVDGGDVGLLLAEWGDC